MGRTTRTSSAIGITLVVLASVCSAAGAQTETIYETDFLDPAQAAVEWEFPPGETEVTEDGYTAAFTTGAFTVTLDGAPNARFYPAFGSADIAALPVNQAVEARVASSSGDPSALFGVACRAALDPQTVGYFFLVGADGYYTIGRYDGRGNAKAIVNANGSKRTDAIDPSDLNVVRGECTGKKKVRLALYVNDEKVVSTVDKSPPKKLGGNALIVTEVAAGETATIEFTGFAAHAL